ncbi:DUF4177 domain-containing protein [Proteiniborus sp. MB09-C3]|uniref:DUF4177 domain-containing protein n=1 Tax=Proteiniborus sp. MB09-C3 TaxID=3050072 RepID=UPI00255760DA|nr:DUF4177 domain-containing protein [Proteiniborus sp. MB09-C3]WIV10660.1 DUF4177 domain-containing protein [Proteiniborus sp. MB09-C3]
MKKFEYKIENIKAFGVTSLVLTKEHEKKFNALGAEGWELVSLKSLNNPRNLIVVFKREIIEG